MRMDFRQFIVFVCDVMFCFSMFCLYMQSKPTPNAWEIAAYSAFLVILLVILYFLVNLIFDAFFE